jgi:hypothetical protein
MGIYHRKWRASITTALPAGLAALLEKPNVQAKNETILRAGSGNFSSVKD